MDLHCRQLRITQKAFRSAEELPCQWTPLRMLAIPVDGEDEGEDDEDEDDADDDDDDDDDDHVEAERDSLTLPACAALMF